MDPSVKRGWRRIDEIDEQKKSEQSSDQIHCYSSIDFLNKRMNIMNEDMLQSYYVMVLDMGVRKFQIDSQKFDKSAAEQVFRNLMKLKRVRRGLKYWLWSVLHFLI